MYMGKKYYKNFSVCIFLGAHNIQMVPKYIWMQHWINLCVAPTEMRLSNNQTMPKCLLFSKDAAIV